MSLPTPTLTAEVMNDLISKTKEYIEHTKHISSVAMERHQTIGSPDICISICENKIACACNSSFVETITGYEDDENAGPSILIPLSDSIAAEEEEKHTGCYSWPHCSDAPTGCFVIMGSDVEEFGHR